MRMVGWHYLIGSQRELSEEEALSFSVLLYWDEIRGSLLCAAEPFLSQGLQRSSVLEPRGEATVSPSRWLFLCFNFMNCCSHRPSVESKHYRIPISNFAHHWRRSLIKFFLNKTFSYIHFFLHHSVKKILFNVTKGNFFSCYSSERVAYPLHSVNRVAHWQNRHLWEPVSLLVNRALEMHLTYNLDILN